MLPTGGKKTKSALGKDRLVVFIGPVFAVFATYSNRIVFAPWLWNGAGLSIFLPVISPVYRQGEHWQEQCQRFAIMAHALFGSLMLFCAMAQFDKAIRRNYPTFHRWTGRGYVVFGFLSLTALYYLRGSMGAGSSPSGRSEALVMFVDVTVALWIGTTSIAVWAAVKRNFDLHRDAMSFSICLAMAPIAQRFASWIIMAPLAMIVRYVFSVTVLSPWQLPWHVMWGPPGSTLSLLFGSCLDAITAGMAAAGDEGGSDSGGSSPYAALSSYSSDPRSCPPVLSLDGYGEGEQASLALSAWSGLIVLCAVGLPPLLSHLIDWLPEPSNPLSPFTSGVPSVNAMSAMEDPHAASEGDTVLIDSVDEAGEPCMGVGGATEAAATCVQGNNSCISIIALSFKVIGSNPPLPGAWFGELLMCDIFRWIASASNRFTCWLSKSLGLLQQLKHKPFTPTFTLAPNPELSWEATPSVAGTAGSMPPPVPVYILSYLLQICGAIVIIAAFLFALMMQTLFLVAAPLVLSIGGFVHICSVLVQVIS